MREWLERRQSRALDTFGERVLFIGIQGSDARGETMPESTIDVVVILDEYRDEDLRYYRASIADFCSGMILAG